MLTNTTYVEIITETNVAAAIPKSPLPNKMRSIPLMIPDKRLTKTNKPTPLLYVPRALFMCSVAFLNCRKEVHASVVAKIQFNAIV